MKYLQACTVCGGCTGNAAYARNAAASWISPESLCAAKYAVTSMPNMHEHNGSWKGSCSDLADELLKINAADISKSPATSIGKILSRMGKKFNDNGIEYIKQRGEQRMNYFFVIK